MDTTTTPVVLPAGVLLHHPHPDDIAVLPLAARPVRRLADRSAPAS
ncbi:MULTISPECIES: hypothetical protein [unclassified Streptomyces]